MADGKSSSELPKTNGTPIKGDTLSPEIRGGSGR